MSPLANGKISFLDQYSSKSNFAEAYRTLRTNVLFSIMNRENFSLLVTSSGQGEGKSSTVANLGYTLAGAGKPVLMIDADMRKPSLSYLCENKKSTGLTGLLAETFSKDIHDGRLEELDVQDLIRLIGLRKSTGKLSLSENGDVVDIFFIRGEMVDLSWPTRPEEQRLASLLIRNDILSKAQAEQALTRQKHTGQKLGFTLLSVGLVKREDLTVYLTIQMVEGLRLALQFKNGRYSFHEFPSDDLERPSFDPVDYSKIYKQIIIGEEKLPYLESRIQDAVIKTPVPNLHLLPVGKIPPNPSEFLASEWMTFLIAHLRKRFPIILFDTPPLLVASDALILAPHADGVVLVIKSGEVDRNLISKAVDQLRLSKANLLGVVLNRINVKENGYYKQYYKYYSKYYGEED